MHSPCSTHWMVTLVWCVLLLAKDKEKDNRSLYVSPCMRQRPCNSQLKFRMVERLIFSSGTRHISRRSLTQRPGVVFAFHLGSRIHPLSQQKSAQKFNQGPQTFHPLSRIEGRNVPSIASPPSPIRQVTTVIGGSRQQGELGRMERTTALNQGYCKHPPGNTKRI